MKIVIDIPEEMYLYAKADMLCGTEVLVSAIKNGTPLPKGHGRMIDVDKMISDFVDSKAISIAERFKIANIVEHQKAIIEADKEEQNNGGNE